MHTFILLTFRHLNQSKVHNSFELLVCMSTRKGPSIKWPSVSRAQYLASSQEEEGDDVTPSIFSFKTTVDSA